MNEDINPPYIIHNVSVSSFMGVAHHLHAQRVPLCLPIHSDRARTQKGGFVGVAKPAFGGFEFGKAKPASGGFVSKPAGAGGFLFGKPAPGGGFGKPKPAASGGGFGGPKPVWQMPVSAGGFLPAKPAPGGRFGKPKPTAVVDLPPKPIGGFAAMPKAVFFRTEILSTYRKFNDLK